ncbi:MAG: ABC transporter ATP-binding protein [Phycisphaerales bacterium]|jgi:branched-chain amino acid transport system ATP-binding protein|nr:ABC transporter ATP-binding protein [Phycisphaerales bacterium]
MALLEISNLSVVFGGLKALCDFDLSLEQGELVGLIGPNGAGKTTTFNIVTGVYRPAAGGVRLGGRSIAGLNPYQINHRGIARTFQNIRLFAGMSVLDNVLVGFNQSLRHGFVGTVLRTPRHQREDKRNQDRAMELLAKLGLDDRAMETAHNLPYGDQRRLEIARALATNPKILLLDEPAAGMNPQEKIELAAMIEMIRTQFRVGIWLIEHDMKLVMSICQRITVLDHGQTIAVGTPDQVRADPRVCEAYLGEPT